MTECIKVHSDGKLTIIFGGYEIEYMRYTLYTLTELLDVNPMPEITRVCKDGRTVKIV